MIVKTGDTVRLKVEFKDFNDNYADPTEIVLRVYNKNKVQISEDISITSAHKISVGIYEYEYEIPSNVMNYIVYEFDGLLGSTHAVNREKLHVEWVG